VSLLPPETTTATVWRAEIGTAPVRSLFRTGPCSAPLAYAGGTIRVSRPNTAALVGSFRRLELAFVRQRLSRRLTREAG
jgi:hypothetical protein